MNEHVTVFNLPLNYKISCANVQLNLSGCSNNFNSEQCGPGKKILKKNFFLRKKKKKKLGLFLIRLIIIASLSSFPLDLHRNVFSVVYQKAVELEPHEMKALAARASEAKKTEKLVPSLTAAATAATAVNRAADVSTVVDAVGATLLLHHLEISVWVGSPIVIRRTFIEGILVPIVYVNPLLPCLRTQYFPTPHQITFFFTCKNLKTVIGQQQRPFKAQVDTKIDLPAVAWAGVD